MTENISTALKQITLFSDLPDENIAQLVEKVKEQNVSSGEILFREGDKGDSLYFILSGQLEIFRGGDGADKTTLAILGKGEYFGEMAILEEKPRTASVSALRDSQLLELCREDFTTLLERNPSLALKMTSAISARLRLSMEAQAAPEVSLQAQNTRVFISYSRRDRDFVQTLHDAISDHGIDTWVDWENIPLTADWWNEIQRGIENADAFAFVISPDSLASEVCNREIQAAVDRNKRVIPILYRDPDPNTPMHETISSHNWVFMRTNDELKASLGEMIQTINTDLDWVRRHTRILQRSLEWENSGRNSAFLLRGDELLNAEAWFSEASTGKQPQPTPLQGEYIHTSRRDTARRQRVIRGFGIAFIFVLVIATIISAIGFQNARNAQATAVAKEQIAIVNEEKALAQQATAEAASTKAVTNEQEARAQRANAEANAAEAQRQQEIAEKRRVEAEEAQALALQQARIAKSGQLAAEAVNQLDAKLDLALLLSVEGYQLNDSLESRNSLFATWGHKFEVGGFLQGHTSKVRAVSWSPDGRLASGSADQNVIIWDLETGLPAQVLRGHDDWVNELAWSADGRLASASGDNTVIVWDLAEGQPALTLDWHLAPVVSLAWSPDGKLASGSEDETIIIWDLEQEEPEQVLEGQDNWVNSIAWSEDGRLASGGDLKVIIWDLDTGQPARTFRQHDDFVESVAWSTDGRLASGDDSGTIYVWDPDTGRVFQTLNREEELILSLAWSPDGQLASGGSDDEIVLWDLENNEPARILEGHEDWVEDLAWSPEGRLASGSLDKLVLLWDLDSAPPRGVMEGHSKDVTSVAWSPFQQLASASEDGTIILWDQQSGKSDQILEGHDSGATSVAWSPDGRLASASKDWSVILWNLESGDPEQYLEGHEGWVNSVAWSPDGRLASGADDFTIIVWNLDLGEPDIILEPDWLVKSVAWSPDGRLASGTVDKKVTIWNLDTGEPAQILLGHKDWVLSVAWSPDGQLASGSADGTVILWNLDTGQPEKIFQGHTDEVRSVAWSPDGQLASSSADDTIILWDVDNGKPYLIIEGHQDSINSLSWSLDGRLASGAEDDQVIQWQIESPATWLEQACQRAGRNLTIEEWTYYRPDEEYHASCQQWPQGAGVETQVSLTTPAPQAGDTLIPSAATEVTIEPTIEEVTDWQVFLSDTFDRNTNDWLEGNVSDEFLRAIREIDRVYTWRVTANQGVFSRVNPAIPDLRDFYLAVDIRKISGPEDAEGGVILRNNNDFDNYYSFGIVDSTQEFSFFAFIEGEWHNIMEYTQTPAIQPGETNRVEVVVEGEHFRFFINGEAVGEAFDNQLESGNAGVSISLSNAGDEAVYEFDNFTIRIPDKPVNPIPTLTQTPTPTPNTGVPQLTALQDAICRTGPGPDYLQIDGLRQGETATIEGRDGFDAWFLITIPRIQGQCWVWGNLVSVEGDISQVPVLKPPPTPSP